MLLKYVDLSPVMFDRCFSNSNGGVQPSYARILPYHCFTPAPHILPVGTYRPTRSQISMDPAFHVPAFSVGKLISCWERLLFTLAPCGLRQVLLGTCNHVFLVRRIRAYGWGGGQRHSFSLTYKIHGMPSYGQESFDFDHTSDVGPQARVL